MACELAQKEDSKLIEVGAVKRTEIVIVKIWKKLVDSSLHLWEKVTDKKYDF